MYSQYNEKTLDNYSYFSDLWLKRDQAITFKTEKGKYQYVKVKI